MAELRYKAYGETRYTWGATPTNRRFTGQLEEGTIGLYDYGARFYDPLLGRFISADPIVPRPGDPQNLNRYSYVRNNPLRYIDPTGYYDNEDWQYTDPDAKAQIIFGIKKTYGVSVVSEDAEWSVSELTCLRQAMDDFPMYKIGRDALRQVVRKKSKDEWTSGEYRSSYGPAGVGTIIIYNNAFDPDYIVGVAGLSLDTGSRVLISHELVHPYQHTGKNGQKRSDSEAFAQVQGSYGGQLGWKSDIREFTGWSNKKHPYPSTSMYMEYGNTNPTEDQAVAVSLYMYARARLQAVSPMRVDLIRREFFPYDSYDY